MNEKEKKTCKEIKPNNEGEADRAFCCICFITLRVDRCAYLH